MKINVPYKNAEEEELVWEKAWFLYEEGLGPNPMDGFKSADQ